MKPKALEINNTVHRHGMIIVDPERRRDSHLPSTPAQAHLQHPHSFSITHPPSFFFYTLLPFPSAPDEPFPVARLNPPYSCPLSPFCKNEKKSRQSTWADTDSSSFFPSSSPFVHTLFFFLFLSSYSLILFVAPRELHPPFLIHALLFMTLRSPLVNTTTTTTSSSPTSPPPTDPSPLSPPSSLPSSPRNATPPEPSTLTSHFVQALHNYLPTNAPADQAVSCLFFRKGAIIEVLNRDDSGWWDGSSGGVRGWFPSNYVGRIGEAVRHSADFDDERSQQEYEAWRQHASSREDVEVKKIKHDGPNNNDKLSASFYFCYVHCLLR